jgi:ankyrin repeat protein
MNINAFLIRISHCRISHLTTMLLIALTCSTPAFCGDIFSAVFSGDLQKVKALLKNKPKLVSSKDNIGRMPLHEAALKGFKDVAELLLANKANVNARDKDGWTPLHEAARYGYRDVMELLLDNKADVNAKTNDGYTPLHRAVENGPKEVVELLLSRGANIKAKDNLGYTPLYAAALGDMPSSGFLSRGHMTAAQLLSPIKGNFMGRNPDFQIPIHEAASAPWPVYFGRTPGWIVASSAGRKEVVELLLSKGSEINAKDKDVWAPLHFAAWNGNKDVVELLLSKGAEVNATDSRDGMTALHFAARNGGKETVELLLANKADVNATDNRDGWMPLHFAAFWDQKGSTKSVAELLLAKGASVNVKARDGSIPLHWAARFNYMDLVQLLLAKRG